MSAGEGILRTQNKTRFLFIYQPVLIALANDRVSGGPSALTALRESTHCRLFKQHLSLSAGSSAKPSHYHSILVLAIAVMWGLIPHRFCCQDPTDMTHSLLLQASCRNSLHGFGVALFWVLSPFLGNVRSSKADTSSSAARSGGELMILLFSSGSFV